MIVKYTKFALVATLVFSWTFSQQVIADDHILSKKRDTLLKAYDSNKNGMLDKSERENMRKDRKKVLERGARTNNRNRNQREQERHPPELLKKYDKDKSGWIDGDEWEVAWPAESEIIKNNYDKDKDGELSDEEKATLMGDLRSQKVKGVYAFIAYNAFLRGPRNQEPAYITRQKKLLKFDSDKDGIASRSELAAIKKHQRELEKK